MNWESFGAFVAMGGYGNYVWGSFLAVAFGFACEALLVARRRRAVLRGLRRQVESDRLAGEPA